MTTGTLKKPLTADAAGSTQSTGGNPSDETVEQKFLEYAQMSPMDRMHANILKSMGLSEQDLKTMTPDQRAAVEQKIKELIEQSFEKNAGKAGQAVDISA
ncbi:ABC-type transporter MlaC component [Bradyrhizobium sp. USDA 4011]